MDKADPEKLLEKWNAHKEAMSKTPCTFCVKPELVCPEIRTGSRPTLAGLASLSFIQLRSF